MTDEGKSPGVDFNIWPMFDKQRNLRIITEEEPEEEFQSFLEKARPTEAEIVANKWADED